MQFPHRLVEAAIRDEIVKSASDRPPTKAGWRPAVDSLIVVCVVLRVERELGIELPEDVMPAGGFDDVEQCVDCILGLSRRLWREKQREGATVS